MLYLHTMKIQLTITLMFLSVMMGGQNVQIIQEMNFGKNIQVLGIQVVNDKGYGVYLSGGSNIVEQLFVINHHFDIQTTHMITGDKWWYSGPDNHVGLNMTSSNAGGFWSLPQYNNQFIDQTTYRAIVNSVWTEKEIKHNLMNVGIVLPMKNTNIRIGGGIYNIKEKGEITNMTLSTIKKVNLYWETNIESYHIIYTQDTYNEKIEKTPINVNRFVPNLNVSVSILTLQNQSLISLGYDTQAGINLGFNYPL